MICQKCGNQLNEGAAFCPMCGTKVDAASGIRVQGTNENSVNQQPMGGQPVNIQQQNPPVPPKKSNQKMIAILIVAGVCCFVVFFLLITAAIGSFVIESSGRESAGLSGDNASQESKITVGTLTYSDGSVYEGEIRDGKANGEGTRTYSNGDYYKGEFKDDLFLNGKGIHTWADDGRFYEGEYKDGKANGEGAMTYADGSMYKGEWKDGQRNGQGVFTWANGNVYDGGFKDSVRSGHGIMTYAEGDQKGRLKYDGNWENDKINGRGIMTYTNGIIYDGDFVDGVYNGQGTLKVPASEVTDFMLDFDLGGAIPLLGDFLESYFGASSGNMVYEGGFVDGVFCGQGIMTFGNGEKYDGAWEDGKPNGIGTMTYEDGTSETGFFVDWGILR